MVLGKFSTNNKRTKIEPYPSACACINSKWIQYFHVRHGTLKLLKEHLCKPLQDKGIGKDFLKRLHIAQQAMLIVEKWSYIEIKNSTQEKNAIHHINIHAKNGRKTLLFLYLLEDS